MAVKLQTIKDIRNYLNTELSGIYPVPEIRSIGDILIYTVLGINKLHYLTGKEQPLISGNISRIRMICDELKTGKPIQYILGETLFYNCNIKVDENTLIPRPETEELVDLIIHENPRFSGNILDIGTGSGCIAIALAKNLPEALVTAIDISEKAISKASENARLNNVNISFYEADILRLHGPLLPKTDIIVSNPPYVTISGKRSMNMNVLGFEPHSALFVPDDDPLIFYQAILDAASEILIPGGKLYLEINEDFGKETEELVLSYGYKNVRIVDDINGKNRMIKAVKDA